MAKEKEKEKTETPIIGWDEIAKAVTKETGSSCSVRTAQRYAKAGRHNRLPVWCYDNGRVYLLPAGLDVWNRSRSMPLGAHPVGGRRARARTQAVAPPTARAA